MAFVLLENRKAMTLTHKQAVALDAVLKGRVVGSDKQQAFARRVKKIYFNKHRLAETEPVEGWWLK